MARTLLLDTLKEIAHMNSKHTTPVDPTATMQAVLNAAALLQQFTTVRDGQMYVLVPMTGLVKDGVPSISTVKATTPAAAETLAEIKAHSRDRATATAHDVVRGSFGQRRPDKYARPAVKRHARTVGRGRFVSKLHHRQKLSNVRVDDRPLAKVQREVLGFIHKAGKEGVTAHEVETFLGRRRGGGAEKGHGPFSSTRRWLSDHGLIEVMEDAVAS